MKVTDTSDVGLGKKGRSPSQSLLPASALYPQANTLVGKRGYRLQIRLGKIRELLIQGF